jgi:hypothetical protein
MRMPRVISRYSFEARVRRDNPSLVFDDVLAKAKGIAVLMASLCQEFSRDLYGNDVNQELPFPSDRRNLQYQIAGIRREILTNQKYLHAEPSQIFGKGQVLSTQRLLVNPQGNPQSFANHFLWAVTKGPRWHRRSRQLGGFFPKQLAFMTSGQACSAAEQIGG